MSRGRLWTLALIVFCLDAHTLYAGTAALPVAAAAEITGDDVRGRFTAELSRPISYSAYVMSDPYRVLIDLPEVDFRLPPGSGKGAGLVRQYRYGAIAPGKSRIVIDTDGPVLITGSFIEKMPSGEGARVVLDLIKTDEPTFDKARAAEPEAATLGSKLKETAAVLGQPHPKPVRNSVTQEGAERTIVIDPGHGGIDPGAVGFNRVREKDVVLAFGLALKTRLESLGRYKIVMTRSDDHFVTLKDRVRVARDNQADLFIAIHADTVRGQSARGATIYTLSDKASDAEAEALAQKENRADIIAGVDLATENQEVTDILIDLAQRETKYHSLNFARRAVSQLKPVTHLTGRPMRSAGFVVLKAPDVPSILLELGYLSSRSDAKLLSSAKWQGQVAGALGTAIDGYFGREIAASR
ncbi:MAG: N-acetylmuramoyl-L-alanine amidase [Hyphomicrobiales bacterium]